MKAKINSPQVYADNSPSFEIGIYDESLPHEYGKRINYNLRINDKVFLCGVRSSEISGLWISPDILDLKTNEKLRLSEILIENGFSQNEEIDLEFIKEKNELVVHSLGIGTNAGNIRSKALKWYRDKYKKQDVGIYASKLYKPEESWTKDYVWFVQIPKQILSDGITDYVHVLCQDVIGGDQFFHLKIPVDFLVKNNESFDQVKNSLALYFSPKAENFLTEIRGKGNISFKSFLQNY